MELIREIYEKGLHMDQSSGSDVSYRLRKAARALIFKGNKIAVLNAVNLYLHKLPGGGIEKTESIAEGLRREILEETGCRIIDTREIGITIEYREQIALLQISYVFTGNVQDTAGAPNFTKKEQGEGFQLVWLDIAEAIKIMKNEDNPNTYAGKFIHARDLAILEYYVRLNSNYEGKQSYRKES